MDSKIYDYKDKWKLFLKRLLIKIDFLSSGCENKILDDIVLELRTKHYQINETIFDYGHNWNQIYIILYGKVDIFIRNNRQVFLETLTQGANIGTYTMLLQGEYKSIWKAKTDWTILVLKYKTIDKLRIKYEKLNNILFEYETSVEEDGPPYWDFKIYRYAFKWKLSLFRYLEMWIWIPNFQLWKYLSNALIGLGLFWKAWARQSILMTYW